MELSTKVEFDAAHRLSFHYGKCKNIHGHRWVVDVTVGVDRFKDMVIDFGIVKQWIKDVFDHKVLVYDQDDILLKATEGFQRVEFPFETTAENLAVYIKTELAKLIFDGFPEDAMVALMVTVHETPDNFVRI